MSNRGTMTPEERLYWHIISGNSKKVTELLSIVDIHTLWFGRNYLLWAVRLRKLSIVKILIDDSRINMNSQEEGKYLNSALHISCYRGFGKIVKYLLSKGIKTDLKDKNGKLAIEICKNSKIRNLFGGDSTIKKENDKKSSENNDITKIVYERNEWRKRYKEISKKYDKISNELERMRKELDVEKYGKYEIPDKDLEITKELGGGGFGEVFEGRWKGKGGNTIVAIKEIEFQSEIPKEEILEEFLKLANSFHPFVIRTLVYSIPEPHKIRIVMERMHSDLFKYVQSNKLDLYKKVCLMKMCTQAVHYLHSNNVIHRDIKASNFLVNSGGNEVKVTDFGMAYTCLFSTKNKSDTLVQKEMGTMFWLAKEVLFEGIQAKYSLASDIYSLGITFFEVIFEKVPYSSYLRKNPVPVFNVLMEIKKKGLKPDYNHPKLPKELKTILDKCLSVKQNERFGGDTSQLLMFFEENEKEFLKLKGVFL